MLKFVVFILVLVVGLGVFLKIHSSKPTLELQQAVSSGGLKLDCPPPYSTAYCEQRQK